MAPSSAARATEVGTSVAARAPSTPSGFVRMQTASGPAYFQQTSSGLMVVNDQAVLSRLKNGAIPTTEQAYSPSLTFATPKATAPSGTVPSPAPVGTPVTTGAPVIVRAPADQPGSTASPASGQFGSMPTVSTTTSRIAPIDGAAAPRSTQQVIPIVVAATTPQTAMQPDPLNTMVTTAVNANERILDSRPGRIVVDSLAAAGGTLVRGPDRLASAVDVANAYRRGAGGFAAASEVAGIVAVESAGAAGFLIGGRPGELVAAGGTQALVRTGQLYVAPWLGDRLYNAAPSGLTLTLASRV